MIWSTSTGPNVRESAEFKALKVQSTLAEQLPNVVFPPSVPGIGDVTTPTWETAVNEIILGKKTGDKALAMVKQYFAPIPRGPEPPPVTTVEPPQMGERRFKIRKPGDTRYLMVSYRNAALTDPDSYALDVLGIVLGHGKTSRLYQSLVEGKLATDVDAANET